MDNKQKKISNKIAALIIITLLSAVAIAGYFTFFSPQSKAFIQQCVQRKACTNNNQCGEGGVCSKKTSSTPVGLCVCKGAKLLWWFDDRSPVCQQRQFMGAYMYFGLKTFATKEECEKVLSSSAQPSISPTNIINQDLDSQLNSLDQNLKEVDNSLNDKPIDVNAN